VEVIGDDGNVDGQLITVVIVLVVMMYMPLTLFNCGRSRAADPTSSSAQSGQYLLASTPSYSWQYRAR